MKQSTLATMVLSLAVTAGLTAQVRINELFTGTPDHIELYNCTASSVDVSGWTVATWYATTAGAAPTAEAPFVLPAGTVIPANGFLVLEENGTQGAPGTLPNSIAYGANYFWVAARTLEVAMTDASGNGIDYVYRDFYGNGTTPNLPAGTSWTGNLTTGTGDDVARNMDVDTDDASDWTDAAIAATTSALNAGQLGGCGGPMAYETNDAAASLDVDGVQTGGFMPAIATSVVCQSSTLTLATINAGQLFELVANLVPLVPGGMPPSFTTAGGQILNVNVLHPTTFWLNGGTGPAFAPLPQPFVVPLAPPVAFNITVQAVITDPGNPEGFSLTQGTDYRNLASLTFPGPTADDDFTMVDLAANGCGAVSFLGTSYDRIYVNSNGRVTFGAGDSDFSVTIIEARLDVPFVGFWSDQAPDVGGSISVIDSGTTVSVDWNGTPYSGEPGSASTFSIVLDRGTGDVMLAGLTGVGQNPATSLDVRDSTFLGLSPGNTASDPGGITFSMGGSGMQGSSTDMLYDFTLYASQTVGVPFLPASLTPGTLNAIMFSTTAGITSWTGL